MSHSNIPYARQLMKLSCVRPPTPTRSDNRSRAVLRKHALDPQTAANSRCLISLNKSECRLPQHALRCFQALAAARPLRAAFSTSCAQSAVRSCVSERCQKIRQHTRLKNGKVNRFEAGQPMARAPGSFRCISVHASLHSTTRCGRPLATERRSRRASGVPDICPKGTSGQPFHASIGATERPHCHDGTWSADVVMDGEALDTVYMP